MNPLVDEKAPYALALLVTLLGWFLTNAVADADKTLLISYEVKPFSDGGKDYAQVLVHNQSLSLPMKGIDVLLLCPDSPCVTAANPLTNGSYSVAHMLSEWVIQAGPVGATRGPDQDRLAFRPDIPARATLSIIIGKVAGAANPIVQFGLPPASARTPEIERGYSWRGYLFSNWFWVLTLGGLVLAGAVVSWIAAIGHAKAKDT